MSFLFVIGYTKTGKDSLFKALNNIKDVDSDKVYWRIYAHPNTNVHSVKFTGRKRVAFADPIKEKIFPIYKQDMKQLPQFNQSLSQKYKEYTNPHYFIIEPKDELVSINFQGQDWIDLLPYSFIDLYKDLKFINGKSFRDYCIAEGQKGRKEDKNKWVDLACKPNLENHCHGTDGRFFNELDRVEELYGSETTSLRIYRSDVPIPPRQVIKVTTDNYEEVKNYEYSHCENALSRWCYIPIEEDTEHACNEILTDFLLVKSQEEFQKALQVFPQYKEFVYKNVVITNDGPFLYSN